MRRGGLGGALSIKFGVEFLESKSFWRNLSWCDGGVLLADLVILFEFKTGVLFSEGGFVLFALDETGVINW